MRVSVLPKNTTQCPWARASAQTAQSGDGCTDHKDTMPPQLNQVTGDYTQKIHLMSCRGIRVKQASGEATDRTSIIPCYGLL